MYKRGQVIIGPTHRTRYKVTSFDVYRDEVVIKNEATGVVSHFFAKTLAKLGYTIEGDDGSSTGES